MPIHDWTRVPSGTFHNFHQDWSIEIYRTLNRGLLPHGYYAIVEQRVSGPEPDVVALKVRDPKPETGGIAVAVSPPQARQKMRATRENVTYAHKANRIAIRDALGDVVAIIEIVSHGNKDSASEFRAFVDKTVGFLRSGIHVVLVDLFPPTRRDPDGIHQVIWDEFTGEPVIARPTDKPLTIAGYDAGTDDGPTAYVDPVAVLDSLPAVPLFLSPERYVSLPLEETYTTCWEGTPQPIRDFMVFSSTSP